MRPNRSWMIRRKDCTGQVTEEFKNGVDDFIKIATRDPTVADALSRIPCPCSKCKNCVTKEVFWVEKHLYQYGFMKDYINWTVHGEDRWEDSSSRSIVHDEEVETRNPYVDTIVDAVLDELNSENQYVQPNSDRAHGSSHNGSASKRPVTSSSRPNSLGEPSGICSSRLVSSNDHLSTTRRVQPGLFKPSQQEYTASSSEDEYSDYDDGEDEEIQLNMERAKQWKLLRQQEADANNVKKGIGAISGVSNNGKMSNATSDSVPHSSDPPLNDPTSLPSSGRSLAETNRRKVISVEAISNPRRFVPQSVTRDITSTVIMRMSTPIEKWKNFPVAIKDELFLDFMGKYKFASDYDRSMARTVWERTCMDRYPDHLKNAREKALKQVNSTNLADTKGHGPKGMKKEVWDGLVDIWLTPKWRKKSDANRRNKAALPDSVLHTGGSISFGEHKRRMEAELKHPVSFRDVYDHVHKKKDGKYVSERSKNFVESYDTVMLEKYGEDSSMHPIVDSEVWADVSGHKKKRVLGGRSLDIDAHGSMATSSSDASGPSRTVVPTNEDIKEAVNKAMSSFVQTQLMPMLEPILSVIGSSQFRNLMHQTPLQGGVGEEDKEDE